MAKNGNLSCTSVFSRQPGAPPDETHRIPALLVLPPTPDKQQWILAFAERRLTPCDTKADLLVLRRGLKDSSGQIEWQREEALNNLCLADHRSMNPTPLYNTSSKKAILFFIAVRKGVSEQRQIKKFRCAARLCFTTSHDTGKTWEPVQDITDTVFGDLLRTFATFAVGPGHGIQLECGRLVVPAYAYHCDVEVDCCGCPHHCTRKSRAFILYSDDGEEWHVGKALPDPWSNECQVAEVKNADGTQQLVVNAKGCDGCRVEAFSTDKGRSFSTGCPVPGLLGSGNGCHGSLLAIDYPPEVLGNIGSLIYSQPTDRKKRQDLGLYVNKKSGDPTAWSKPFILHQGPAGYSDLAYLSGPDPSLACLFECGKKCYHEEIIFKTLPLRNLFDELPSNVCG
uniref:exo-alpha-sialidase n=1 Tax=Eptatretus burgeri TaxID=7764 RepID=A0A8C4Q321_EPTBU